MIREQDLYGIKHYDYGEAFYGSEGRMRFRVSRDPLENVVFKDEAYKKEQNPRLVAEVWFEDKAYDRASKDGITKKEFEYSPEGYSEMITWLRDQAEGEI